MYITSAIIIIVLNIALSVMIPIMKSKATRKTAKAVVVALSIVSFLGLLGIILLPISFFSKISMINENYGSSVAEWAEDMFVLYFKWETLSAVAVLVLSSISQSITKGKGILADSVILFATAILLIASPIYASMTDNNYIDIKTYLLLYTLSLCLFLMCERIISVWKTIKQKNNR